MLSDQAFDFEDSFDLFLCFYLLLNFLQTYTAKSNESTSRSSGEYHCVWYGECNKIGILSQNCPYNGTAKPLDTEGQRLLAKWCPKLLVDKGDGVKTCCDTSQLKTLDKSIMIAANFLQRCPSCIHNFVQQVCELTCGPEQSRFIDVTEIKTNQNGKF